MINTTAFTLPKFLKFGGFAGAKNLIKKLSETETKIEKSYEKEFYHYNIMPSERISFLALKYGTAGSAKSDYQFIK